jgi:phage-related baseplate assembly protein
MVRFNLPEIDFVEVDAEELEAIAVGKFEEATGIKLSDSDPRRKFIQANVYIATLLANNIDFTGKQNLLAYAQDNFLDHLGVKKNVPRLGPSPAETTIRFEVNNPETFVITKDTYLSVNNINFYIAEDTVVPAGATYVDVKAICEEPGTIGNGFLPGQITNIVNPPPWVIKAYNITKSDGGVDWEEDDPYAERIRQSNSQYSTAGPEDAYKYHAMSANSLIVDVSVSSPSEGRILIVPLLKNGEIPSDEILNQVYEKVNDKKVRPLTDYVTVQRPDIVPYDIDLTYYVPSEKANVVSSIQDAVNKAVEDYQIWQKSKLGRGIDSSELISRVKAAGGVRITVNSPSSYAGLNKTQVAVANNVACTFGGIVDD